MEKIQRLFPQGLPKAIGPYSPVTAIGDIIFVSGQIPINPQTGEVDQKQNIQWQAHQCMKNLRTAVEGADSSLANITKTTILLTNMEDFPKVNQIYGSYFQQNKYPARACYAVAALPRKVMIEIEAVAIRNSINETLKKKIKTQ